MYTRSYCVFYIRRRLFNSGVTDSDTSMGFSLVGSLQDPTYMEGLLDLVFNNTLLSVVHESPRLIEGQVMQ